MKFPTQTSRFILILILAAIAGLLSACGGASSVRPGQQGAESGAEAEVSTVPIGADNRELSASRLPETGSLANATEYLQQAASAQGEEKQTLLMRAIRIMLDNGQYNRAQQIYREISAQGLSAEAAARYQLLGAKLALLNGDAATARAAANRILAGDSHDPDILGDALELLAESDIQLRSYASAIDHYIEAESYRNSDQAVQNTRYRIAQLLASLDNKQLSRIRQNAHNASSRAWAELALIYRKWAAEPEQLAQRLAAWRQQYPDHKGERYLSEQFPGGKPARQVALLLPISSKFAGAANAVRSGFLAMQAADASPQAPLVKVYDIGGIPELAAEVYQRAVDEGADFVVGPLGKASVQNMLDTVRFSVPTLLLGDAVGSPAGSAVYQLGLSPEQESAQLAQHAWLDNKRTAVVLYPEGAWGQRVSGAFRTQWDQLGGTTLGSAPYKKGQADYSPVIKQLTGVTQRYARRNRLARLLGVNLKFKPRKRDDIDFIALFASPSQGRLIKPQLDFYAGLRMPVYSISRIYSGKKNKVRDADLNGVIFGDMPWLLVGNRQVSSIKKHLRESGNTPNESSRLYALGVDAYQLVPYLSGNPSAQRIELQGVTGRLQLQSDGRFQRWLTWAQFRHGEPALIDHFFGYADNNGLAEEKP